MAIESNKQKILTEYNKLVDEGNDLLSKAHKLHQEGKNIIFDINIEYYTWFSRALSLVRNLMPERYEEFYCLYRFVKRKEINIENFSIYDFFLGFNIAIGDKNMFDPFGMFFSKFYTQMAIIISCKTRIDSAISSINSLLQADLFDSEIEAAQELVKKGHIRAGGAFAGVTLEQHLKELLTKYAIKLQKTKPAINDFNDALYKSEIYDISTMRFIQYLADIRNLCDHPKEQEPRAEVVKEMIHGVERIIKTI